MMLEYNNYSSFFSFCFFWDTLLVKKNYLHVCIYAYTKNRVTIFGVAVTHISLL